MPRDSSQRQLPDARRRAAFLPALPQIQQHADDDDAGHDRQQQIAIMAVASLAIALRAQAFLKIGPAHLPPGGGGGDGGLRRAVALIPRRHGLRQQKVVNRRDMHHVTFASLGVMPVSVSTISAARLRTRTLGSRRASDDTCRNSPGK